MSYFPFVADENTNLTLRAIKDSFGFVPNYYRAQTLRPDLVDVEAQLVDAILVKEGALTRQQKEYIFLVCSAANLNTYCLTAHCEIVRMLGIEGPEPEQIALDHTAAKIAVPLKALLNFAAKLNGQPTKITKRDIDVLRTYGYNDQQIMEAVLMVALAKFTNFVAFGLGTTPDFDPSQKILAHVGAVAGNVR
jgi:uncharacterized peroxidase-related enzyme